MDLIRSNPWMDPTLSHQEDTVGPTGYPLLPGPSLLWWSLDMYLFTPPYWGVNNPPLLAY